MSNIPQPEKGEFPFPLDDASGRSRFLVWIRNRSSYLTVGGIGNVFASLASFAWGVFKNLTCLLPVYLLAGLVLGWLHFVLLEYWLAASVAIALVFTGVATYLDWIRAKVTDPAAREVSDIESRMEWIRIGGWLLLGVLIGICIILVPRAVELLRDYCRGGLWSGTGIVSSVGGAIAAITGLQRFLPKAEGSQKIKAGASIALTITAITLLAFALIAVCDFVVYGNVLAVLCHCVTECSIGEFWVYLATFVSSLLFIAVCLGLRYRGMGQADLFFGFLISVVPLGVLVLFAHPKNESFNKQFLAMTQSVGALTRPLSLLVSKPLEGVELADAYKTLLPNLRAQSDGLTNFFSLQPKSDREGEFVHSEWQTRCYGMAQTFAMDGQELLEADPLLFADLKTIFCRIDRRGLVQLAQQKINGVNGNHRVLNASVHARCQQAVAAGTLRRLLVRNDEQTNRLEALSLSEVLSDETIDTVFAILRKQHPSAVEEEQFASLTGRGSELVETEIARRNTLGALASIPVIGGSDPSTEMTTHLRRTILRHRLSNETERARVSAASAANTLPDAFSELIREELDRATLMSAIENATRNEVAVYALGTVNDSENGGIPKLARMVIVNWALDPEHQQNRWAVRQLSLLTQPAIPEDQHIERIEAMRVYQMRLASLFTADELIAIAMSRFSVDPADESVAAEIAAADTAVMGVAASKYGDLSELRSIRGELSQQAFPLKLRLFLWLAGVVGTFCFVAININATSIHGFYRDRLSSTFLLRELNERVVPENSVRMSETCQAGSTSPYPLINTAANMQSSSDLGLRDRRSDCFVFTKLFSGGSRTGYVKTIELEAARPELRLNTAMAISAAAASPNMGRMTSSFTTLLMTLLNIRLGYWIPNPRFLTPQRNTFGQVFETELLTQIQHRWKTVYSESEQAQRGEPDTEPACRNGLFGLAFSGGGIRSASLNIGIAQVLHHAGLFRHFDYLSSVSGGGYTACAISTLMRFGTPEAFSSAASSSTDDDLAKNREAGSFRGFVKSQNQIWRLPHLNLGREMISCLHEGQNWVNVSDGGHIENLATIELLRRRCKFIVIGDGEADPDHTFNGVVTLIEFAELELNAKINLPLDDLKLSRTATAGEARLSNEHFAIGTVEYLDEADVTERVGYILYLKSSLTGDEPEVVEGYAAAHDRFPHEPTSDQFFDISQFEAYRNLGIHVARSAMHALVSAGQGVDIRTGAAAPDIKDALNDFSIACSAFEQLSEMRIKAGKAE